MALRRSRRPRRPAWVRLSDQDLLDLRFRDLGLRIQDSVIPGRVDRVYEEMRSRGLRIRPHVWLAEEWFSPVKVPGVAVPFYLAHPRLMQLEARQMLEVEGGTETWCLKLLRHEIGHAVGTAYRLPSRRRWQKVFGKVSRPYPVQYQPRPYSKRFVLHLDWWYAQSHPLEDFAETFAVWLRPSSSWRRQYAGWPALRKLEYVEELMGEIAGKPAPVKSRRQVEPVSRLGRTLREHYEAKRARYRTDFPEIYDRDLRRLFSDSPGNGRRHSAARFLRRIRSEVRRAVARASGEHSYTVDQILKAMTVRARRLGLYVDRPEEDLRLETATLVSMQILNYLHGGGRHWISV